jgi:ornithine carbamoyltransferase
VVNLLSDQSHPCQALADAMTIMDEFGSDVSTRTVAFVGDGNNVARSMLEVCAMTGMAFVLACPPGFELDEGFLQQLQARTPGLDARTTHDALAAVSDADVIYTDTWISMGQEDESERRRAAFSKFQVNAQLLSEAPPHAIVLHCLPAYRDVEITDDVIEGPRSRVFPQAHNRLHAQKGLLAVLLGDGPGPGPAA